jgi:hypothetical protein
MSHILQIPETSKLRVEYGDQVDLSSLTASQLLRLKSQLDGEYSISLVRRPTPSREQLTDMQNRLLMIQEYIATHPISSIEYNYASSVDVSGYESLLEFRKTMVVDVFSEDNTSETLHQLYFKVIDEKSLVNVYPSLKGYNRRVLKTNKEIDNLSEIMRGRWYDKDEGMWHMKKDKSTGLEDAIVNMIPVACELVMEIFAKHETALDLGEGKVGVQIIMEDETEVCKQLVNLWVFRKGLYLAPLPGQSPRLNPDLSASSVDQLRTNIIRIYLKQDWSDLGHGSQDLSKWVEKERARNSESWASWVLTSPLAYVSSKMQDGTNAMSDSVERVYTDVKSGATSIVLSISLGLVILISGGGVGWGK